MKLQQKCSNINATSEVTCLQSHSDHPSQQILERKFSSDIEEAELKLKEDMIESESKHRYNVGMESSKTLCILHNNRRRFCLSRLKVMKQCLPLKISPSVSYSKVCPQMPQLLVYKLR